VSSDGFADDSGLSVGRQPGQTEQINAGRGAALLKNQRAEIFIRCNQHGAVFDRKCEHILVGNARGEFGHIPHRLAIGSQPSNDWGIDAFIGDQVHTADSSTG